MDNSTIDANEPGGRGIVFYKFMFGLINIIIFIIGAFGNSLVIYVIARFKEMHVVTNIYLMSQAISDLLYLLQIPFLVVTHIMGRWIFGYGFCKCYMLLAGVIWFAGLFTLTAVSADRYVAVVHFRTQSKYRTKLRAVLVVIFLWLLSMIVMTPINIYSTVEVNKKPVCKIAWPDSASQVYFTFYTFCLGYAIPVILIVIFYTLIVKRLRSSGPENRNRSKQNKVTTLVLVVVLSYIILWLPYWSNQVYLVVQLTKYLSMRASNVTFESMSANDTDTAAQQQSIQNSIILSFFFQSLSYTNSAINPVLYAFMSQNFRTCFKAVCRCGSSFGRLGVFENSSVAATRTRATVANSPPPTTYEAISAVPDDHAPPCSIPTKFVILHLSQGNGVDSPELMLEKPGIQETDID